MISKNVNILSHGVNIKVQMKKSFNYQWTQVLTFEFIRGHLLLSSENGYQRLSAIICVPI